MLKTEQNQVITKEQTRYLTQNPMSKEPNCEPETLEISFLSYEISAVIWYREN